MDENKKGSKSLRWGWSAKEKCDKYEEAAQHQIDVSSALLLQGSNHIVTELTVPRARKVEFKNQSLSAYQHGIGTTSDRIGISDKDTEQAGDINEHVDTSLSHVTTVLVNVRTVKSCITVDQEKQRTAIEPAAEATATSRTRTTTTKKHSQQ